MHVTQWGPERKSTTVPGGRTGRRSWMRARRGLQRNNELKSPTQGTRKGNGLCTYANCVMLCLKKTFGTDQTLPLQTDDGTIKPPSTPATSRHPFPSDTQVGHIKSRRRAGILEVVKLSLFSLVDRWGLFAFKIDNSFVKELLCHLDQ